MKTLVLVVALAAATLGPGEGEQPKKAKAAKTQGGNRLLAPMDKDGNGELSREEYLGSDAVFKRLDADGNGAISAEEGAKAAKYASILMWDLVDREALFKALDGDQDGSVTAEEMKQANLAEIMAKALAGVKQQLAAGAKEGDLVTRFDKDGDGRVSRDEFPPEHLAKFDKLDRNADGFVDAEEMAKVKGKAAKGGGRADIVKKLDRNGDGKISRDEFPQAKIQAFDRLDANGDGAITPDELGAPKGGKPEAEKPANF